MQSRANLNGGELDWELLKEGAQARANLNGGELDKEPVLSDERGHTTENKDSAQPSDRPEMAASAGARACQRNKEEDLGRPSYL